jgi:hypothetical protein
MPFVLGSIVHQGTAEYFKDVDVKSVSEYPQPRAVADIL